MKQLLPIFILFIVGSAYGQKDCNCNKALDNLITKIENDYPGFEVKTKDTLLYNSFKKQLIVEANTTEQALCFDVLKKYTSFFRDQHIWFSQVVSSSSKESDKTEFIEVDVDKFLKDSKLEINSLEGVWRYSSIDNEKVDFKVGIVKTMEDEYVGFEIPSEHENSESKRVLFKLSSNDRYKSYFPDKIQHFLGNYEVHDHTFLYFKSIERILIKEDKAVELSKEALDKKVEELRGFRIKQLSNKTALFTLPSFDYPYVKAINNLIKDNRNLLENSENLIIDIRGNPGGTGNAFQKLLPYIMTNPIRDMWIEFLATQTLIDGLESYVESIKDDDESQKEVKEVKEEIKLFKKNLGQFVNTAEDTFFIKEIDLAEKSPTYVVILIDKIVGSSGEDFVIAAKQSKKVKVLGTPSSGSIDYASVYEFDFGCSDYKLYLPTFRSLRLPDYSIDNIGIQPDIYLDSSVTDWIKFAQEYLEN